MQRILSPITRSMRAATCSSARPCSKAFQAFLASSACVASATSYHSCSAAPLPWPSAVSWAAPVFKSGRPLLAFGSNFAVKRTASPPLTLAVSLPRVCVPTSQPMVALPAVVHSQVLPLAFGRSAGLRLRGFGPFGSCLVTARRLWSHLARAVSLGGCVVFHPAGSNPAVKLTRQRRAAYFVR